MRLDQSGFTTLDVLVGSFMSLFLLFTVTEFSFTQQSALRDQSKQVDMQTLARNTLQLFSREIRRAGADPTCADTFDGLALATAQRLTVLSDLDGSGAIEAGNEDLSYRLDPETSTLVRTQDGASDDLIEGIDIENSAIRYFDAAGTELVPAPSLSAAERDAVRRVRMELAVRQGDENPHIEIASDVNLRSRFFLKDTGCS